MWSSIAFAVFLLIVSALMLARHVHVWRSASRDDLDERERDYMRRQYRRRMQASGMIGLVGLMVIGGLWVEGTVVTAGYWSIAALLVVWMGLLAMADLVSTRFFFYQLRKEQLSEHAALRSELDRLRRRDSNGRHKADEPQEKTNDEDA